MAALSRNELVHAVIWPKGNKSNLALIDGEGVIHGRITVEEPLRGSDLAKMIPDGLWLDPQNCTVISMSGELLVNTKAPFDTAVVTERAETSLEQRLAMLERRERRREERERKNREENERLRQQIADQQVIEEQEEQQQQQEEQQEQQEEQQDA